MTDSLRRLTSSQHMALHMGTTTPPAIAGPHVIMGESRSGLPVLQQFRTSESERCEQHTVVQRATLPRSLLATL